MCLTSCHENGCDIWNTWCAKSCYTLVTLPMLFSPEILYLMYTAMSAVLVRIDYGVNSCLSNAQVISHEVWLHMDFKEWKDEWDHYANLNEFIIPIFSSAWFLSFTQPIWFEMFMHYDYITMHYRNILQLRWLSMIDKWHVIINVVNVVQVYRTKVNRIMSMENTSQPLWDIVCIWTPQCRHFYAHQTITCTNRGFLLLFHMCYFVPKPLF